MMRYTFTDDAERDFDGVARDLEALQKEPALRIGRSIQQALDLICRYPEIRRVDERLQRSSGQQVRRITCWPYILYYLRTETQIRIVGLIDSRRDAESFLRARVG